MRPQLIGVTAAMAAIAFPAAPALAESSSAPPHGPQTWFHSASLP